MTCSEDSRLVDQCLNGDLQAFEVLIDKYQQPVYNVIFRMCHHTEDARDVTQNVFVKVYNNLATFNRELKFFSWIYRIAINETLNYLHQKKPMEELSPTIESQEENPVSYLEQAEVSENIHRALLEIETKYRSLIVLKHFQNCSYQQIAEITDLPEKTIKSRLYIGRQLLAKVLLRKGIT